MWLEASANELSVAVSPPSSTLAVQARPALCCSQRQHHPAACLSLLWAAGGQGMRAPGQGSPPGFLSTLPGSAVSVLQGSGHTDTQLHEGTGWGVRGVGMDVDKAVW